MGSGAPRWTRSVRRRPAAFFAVLLLSAGAVLVSVTTPVLIDAVDAVALREQVAAAPFPEDGISATASSDTSDDRVDVENAVGGVLGAAAGASDRFGAPQQVDELQAVPRLVGPGRAPLPVRYSIDVDGCQGLRLTGRCPTDAFEAALPTALARQTGWGVGTTVTAKRFDPDGLPQYTSLGTVRIVGVYDSTTGRGAVIADPTRLVQQTSARAVPNLLVGTAHLARLRAGVQTVGAVRIARPVAQSDVAPLRRAVDAAKRAALDTGTSYYAPVVTSRIGVLLDDVRQQQAAAAVLAAPVGLEALLLAWFALGAVAQRTARARAAEWGLGRMRGARRRSWLAAVFTEPVVAVLLGAVVGLALALATTRLAALLLLGTAQDVDPLRPAALTGAGLALAGSLVALVAASARAALLPLPRLLQDTVEPRQLSRPALVLQVALVAVAAAVVWAALTTSSFGGQQLGLLLPAMLALVAGLAAVGFAVLLVRRGSRRAPRTLTGLVVGRGVARAPSALVAAQIVLVSAALAACALQLAAVSTAVQTQRAELAVGADRVLSVEAPRGASLVDLVRRADPSGRVAMAAEQIVGSDADAGGRVLAVDAARLAAVSDWRPAWRRGVAPDRLAPSTGPDLVVRGSRMTVDLAHASADALDGGAPVDVGLEAVIAAPDGWTTVGLGAVRNGSRSASIPCADGCRVVALTFSGAGAPGWTATATLSGLSTDLEPAERFADWLRPARWRQRIADRFDATGALGASVTDGLGGLGISAVDPGGSSSPAIEPAVGPALVPAVLGSEAPLADIPGTRTGAIGTSLSGAPTVLQPIAETVAVPRALRRGVVVDLATMLRSEDPAIVSAQQQVWLAPAGQRAVVAALRADGVRVIGDERASAAVEAGLRTATDRALRTLEATAAAGVLFGLLALAATRIVDRGERRRERVALRLAGVPAGRLRRIAFVETAVPATVAAVVGAVVGSLSATLIAGRLPLLVGEAAGPPLDLAPPLVPLVALTAALVGLVALTGAAVTAAETRGSR